MGANLIEQLKQVEDFRTTDGRRHPLWLVLLFVIMGTMNGYVGYRGWGDFVKRHRRVLIEKFGIQKHRSTLLFNNPTCNHRSRFR
ncbi:transposase family protein [Nostoc sp.]|uniref:transposase family protein n=1 Tax=Nostoc sp. TaxID=1180 RepID=UPI003FA52DCA